MVDFYRHFYRQSVRHQHWRGFPGDSTKSDLSRSIDIYRLRRAFSKLSMDAIAGSTRTTHAHCIELHKSLSANVFSQPILPSQGYTSLRSRDICSRHDRDNPIPRETSDPVVVPEADQAVGHLKDDSGFLNHARDTAISPHAKSRTVADALCPGGAELLVAH